MLRAREQDRWAVVSRLLVKPAVWVEADDVASTLELALVSEEIMRLDVNAVLEAQALARPPAAGAEATNPDDEPTEFIPSDVLISETRTALKPRPGPESRSIVVSERTLVIVAWMGVQRGLVGPFSLASRPVDSSSWG